MRPRLSVHAHRWSLLVLAFLLGLGCAAFGNAHTRYTYFSAPAPNDAWSPKIAGWQRREVRDEGFLAAATPPVSDAPADPIALEADVPSGELRAKYFSFRAERKRALAREVADWIQSQAREHYVEDGPIDHWATLEETLRGDGDDCDGLELLTFHALRDLGFDPKEVYRSIVYRPADGQHHMVTLWFEDPDDPWVIDPTGAMTVGMPRMSEMPAWIPIKVFSDTVEYTVRARDPRAPTTSLAANE